jgi:hypothetical protein
MRDLGWSGWDGVQKYESELKEKRCTMEDGRDEEE